LEHPWHLEEVEKMLKRQRLRGFEKMMNWSADSIGILKNVTLE
jgi:hypothetical protein